MENWTDMTKEELSEYLTKELAGKEFDTYSADYKMRLLLSAVIPKEYQNDTYVRQPDGRSNQFSVTYKGYYLFTITVKKVVDEKRSTRGYLGSRKYNFVSLTVEGHDTIGAAYLDVTEQLENKAAIEKIREEQSYEVYKSILTMYPFMDHYEVYRLVQWMVDHRYSTCEKFEDRYKKEISEKSLNFGLQSNQSMI